MLPGSKLYYKAMVIKTVWYWHNEKHIDQQNRRESSEINPHIHNQFYNTEAKYIQFEKDSLFKKHCWGNWTATCKRVKLDHYTKTRPYTKINSKRVKVLNVKPETIKLDKNRHNTL